ncbi:MAG: helix-turn-helix domain-containing protein [Candidatus Limnocylindria bacterium]
MTTRRDPIGEATRRAMRQSLDVIEEARRARLARGISHAQVAAALGCSRQLIGALEGGRLGSVGLVQLVRYCAAVGLDLPLRTYPATSPLRDIGQVRLLARLEKSIGPAWRWRSEVPVTDDPRDQRAIDAVLFNPPHRVGIEAVTRLVDAQAQTRPIMLKQQAAGLDCMILVLANTRTNRRAAEEGAATLHSAFPVGARSVLADLRSGHAPRGNGLVLL